MFLTRKQAEQIVKQGRGNRQTITKILQSMDFPVHDAIFSTKTSDMDLRVYNSDRTMTRITRQGNNPISVTIEPVVKGTFLVEED